MPAEHRDDHRQPLRIDARPDAARHREIGRRDERLHLEQDRPRALEHAADRRTDLARMRRPEELGRIGHADEPRRGHLEDAELVRRAEAVLRRTQDAMLVVAVTFELQHAVDEVLEDAGPATAPSFVTWPTSTVATPASFATRRSRPAASRTCATEPGAEPSADAWSVCTESMTQTSGRSASSVAHTVSSSVSARISTGSAPPRRAARSDTCAARLLTGHEQRAATAARDRAERREQERGLPDARLTADEDERCGHEPATQHTVELGDAGRDALGFVGRDVPDRHGLCGPRGAGLRRRAVELLDERPEGAAARALPEPTTRCRAALRARELNGDLRHGSASVGRRSDAVGHESVRVRLQVGPVWIRVP